MDRDDIKKKILEEEDYIRSPKHNNSLNKFLVKNPEGAEDATIARVLMISEEEVQKLYEESINMLRESMVKDEA